MPHGTIVSGIDDTTGDDVPLSIEHTSGGVKVYGAGVTLAPSTPYGSAALEASAVLKASGGTFRSLYVELDPATPSGTYYVLLMHGSATVPANGAVTLLRPPQTFVHTMGVLDPGITFDEGDAGILFTTGLTACISTTRFTKTISGAYCLFFGSVL